MTRQERPHWDVRIVCSDGHEAQRSLVMRASHFDAEPRWSFDSVAPSGPPSKHFVRNVGGADVTNEQEFAELFEGEAEAAKKVSMRCPHPRCGLRLQRHRSALVPLLDVLWDGHGRPDEGEFTVELRHLIHMDQDFVR